MANGLTNVEVEKCVYEVIPKIEAYLSDKSIKPSEKKDTLSLYKKTLLMTAPYNFHSFNKYLEINEDITQKSQCFYGHRKDHLREIFDAFNDIEMYDAYDYLIIACPPRVGKALSMDTKIFTTRGWVANKDLLMDDLVYGSDGKPHKILGIYPQGLKTMYRLEFMDGTTIKCSADHLWNVMTERMGTRKKNAHKIFTIDTKTIAGGFFIHSDGDRTFYIPCPEPIEFGTPVSVDKLDPYSYGLAMGCKDISNFYGYPKNTFYEMRRIFRNKRNKLDEEYLSTTVFDRKEFLAGFTEHNYFKDRKRIGCVVPNRVVGSQILYIVHSLGGEGRLTLVNGELRLSFWLPFALNFRKKEDFLFDPTKLVKREIVDVVAIPPEECQCIEVDSEDHLFIIDSFLPTHNTTTGLRFLNWTMGRKPFDSKVAVSYSETITGMFYNGTLNIAQSPEFLDIFPESTVVNQNAKKLQIWLKDPLRMFPSITFAPLGGSITGRCEASDYLYCDDLVSGFEEATSLPRLEKLWSLYSVNLQQRRLDGAKEIHLATPWSVHDVIDRLMIEGANNDRIKIIKLPWYNEKMESRFDFPFGFSTEYYNDLKEKIDEASFSAIYECEPIERDGLLYPEDSLKYYFELPNKEPDTIISVCDSKNLGKDFVCAPIGYVYGKDIYIEDVVYNNGLPDVTRPLVASAMLKNKVVRLDVELNNGGNYYAEELANIIKSKNGNTSIRTFFTSSNKRVKIITYSDYVKENFYFKHKSTYASGSDYDKYIRALKSWTQTGLNRVDDAPDATAMLAQKASELVGNKISVIDRKLLGI